jgi:hypothetical protein
MKRVASHVTARALLALPDLSMAKRGAFVVIEGLDRAGKTTQCARLLARVPGAVLLKFPGACARPHA